MSYPLIEARNEARSATEKVFSQKNIKLTPESYKKLFQVPPENMGDYGFPCFFLTIFILKFNDSVFNAFDAVVGDGDAEDVGGEILQGGQSSAYRLAMHDPVFLPHLRGDVGEGGGVAQGVAELGAEDPGEGLDGEQEVLLGGQPGPIGGPTSGRDQVVHVRMERQDTAPGMEDADHADLSTDEAGVLGQVLRRSGGGAEEQVVA